MLTQERLKEVLEYNKSTGDFTRKVNRYRSDLLGKLAGTSRKNGYRIIRIDGVDYYSHRLAFLYMEGYTPENQVDHIDRDKANNRWCNLREVTQFCNSRNTGLSSANTTGVKGVVWWSRDSNWKAQIHASGFGHNLGYYNDFTNAVCARLAAEQCLDWSNCDSSSPAYTYVRDYLQSR